MSHFLRHVLAPAIALLVAMTVITGAAYPAVVTLIAQVAFPSQANGSFITVNGQDRRLEPDRPGLRPAEVLLGPPVGRRRDAPATRPATTARRAAGSNLGPTSAALIANIQAQVDRLRAANGNAPIPVDLVTASASGLDPDISPAAADYQVARVAAARGMTDDAVRAIVARHTTAAPAGLHR